MSSQLENNNTTIQALLEQINTLPGVSVTSVNAKTGKVVITASDIDGIFAGAVVAHESSQSPDVSLLRNSRLVATETTPTHNGEICWVYE
jgi:hypothetical protein